MHAAVEDYRHKKTWQSISFQLVQVESSLQNFQLLVREPALPALSRHFRTLHCALAYFPRDFVHAPVQPVARQFRRELVVDRAVGVVTQHLLPADVSTFELGDFVAPMQQLEGGDGVLKFQHRFTLKNRILLVNCTNITGIQLTIKRKLIKLFIKNH